MRSAIVLSSLILITTYCAAIAHGAPLLAVENVRWTNSVDPQTRQFDHVYKSPISAKSVVLWVQLNGSPELLKKLQSNASGSIPIKFMWYRITDFDVLGDGVVQVPVGRKDELQKLSFEADATGFFRWRVWSSKKTVGKGIWRADLLYANNQPVMCTVNKEEQPCRYEVETI